MFKQYARIKAAHPDALLFFHLGDFYEAFFEDAEILAREMDVVLTSRNGNPMAGVPVRRGEAYVNRLLRRGYKVAICQQMEDPRQATGLVKREVVRVVTPGTTFEEEALDQGENNYLVAVLADGDRFGLARLDLSTGEFAATEAGNREALRGELARLVPSEVLLPEGEDALRGALPRTTVTVLPRSAWDPGQVVSPGDAVPRAALVAAAAVQGYAAQTQRGSLAHLRPLRFYSLSDQMDLDAFTVRSLELVRPLREGQERGTLLGVLDSAATGMGRRLLRRWILAPLTDRAAIEARWDAVEALASSEIVRADLAAALKGTHDLERLTGRLGGRRMTPPDLARLLEGLGAMPRVASPLRELLRAAPSGPDLLIDVAEALAPSALSSLCDGLAGMLVDRPPLDPREGDLIREGFDPEIDRLRAEVREVRAGLATLEQQERERTGISSLKVGYNRVFGYYLEVTRPHLAKVPQEYERRQTLAGGERFVTAELRAAEEHIARAEERAKALEAERFHEALARLEGEIPLLQGVADAVGRLDVLLSLATAATRNGYVRPRFGDGSSLSIRAGRHPVVERVVEFVPNDLVLEPPKTLVILTGPNMAGKSVYLRQAALILLMAQIGSFVPAREALLPVVDRVFARVGASDALVDGVSTFMMEMLEVAAILEGATPRSLVILDEMGRGTSTYDGVSIAWAVAEELATRVRARTLFATHYQELTELAERLPSVVNLHVAVKEVGREVVFLHSVVPGVAERSYGIHVARLAGLPERVTRDAEEILDGFGEEKGASPLLPRKPRAAALPLFAPGEHPLLEELRRVDPNRLTPLQALELLAKWKERL